MAVDLSEIPATVEDALREVSKIKSLVAEAVEDGLPRPDGPGQGYHEPLVDRPAHEVPPAAEKSSCHTSVDSDQPASWVSRSAPIAPR